MSEFTDPAQLLETGISLTIMTAIFGIGEFNSSKASAIQQAYEKGDLKKAAQLSIEGIEEVKGKASPEDAKIFDLINNQLVLYVAPNGQVSPINPNDLQALPPGTGVTENVTNTGMELNPDIDSEGKMGDNGGQDNIVSGKLITEISHKPSSGAIINASPGKTTTVIGSFDKDMRFILDETGNVKSTDFGPRDGGINVLNIPDEIYKNMTREQFWEGYNKRWLDNAIKRGDDIILVTKPEGKAMQSYNKTTGEWEPSGFAREYQYLIDNGYHYDSTTNMMIK